jgi:hypothetical protein
MLCGYRRYSAMATWGRHYGARLAPALGFPHDTPCAANIVAACRRFAAQPDLALTLIGIKLENCAR